MGKKDSDMIVVGEDEIIQQAIENGKGPDEDWDKVNRSVTVILSIIGMLLVTLQMIQIIISEFRGDSEIYKWLIVESVMLFFLGIIVSAFSLRVRRVVVKNICMWLGFFYVGNMIWLALVTKFIAWAVSLFGA